MFIWKHMMDVCLWWLLFILLSPQHQRQKKIIISPPFSQTKLRCLVYPEDVTNQHSAAEYRYQITKSHRHMKVPNVALQFYETMWLPPSKCYIDVMQSKQLSVISLVLKNKSSETYCTHALSICWVWTCYHNMFFI